MTKGEIEYAIRISLNNFDKWNDVTTQFERGSSYYYEIQGVIEDAVRIGSKIACEGINTDLSDIIGENEEDSQRELELENAVRRIVKVKGNMVSSGRADNKINE